DNTSTMPPRSRYAYGTITGPLSRLDGCMGGKDPARAFTNNYAPAVDRPLRKYVPTPETFHCPADRGRDSDLFQNPRPKADLLWACRCQTRRSIAGTRNTTSCCALARTEK